MPVSSNQETNAINQRLTGLWALSEAGLGGLLHAFKLPFTGILVGGFALLSVTMLAWHNQLKTLAITRSWAIVSAVKFGLSPHSPLTAYIAVSFQAFFSLLCFRLIPNFRLAAVVSGAVCTLESALQRILVLTLLFGVGLWAAIDQFTAKLLQQFGTSSDWSGSTWLVGTYLGVHLATGSLIGWWAGQLPQMLQALPPELLLQMEANISAKQQEIPQKTARSHWKQWQTPVLLTLFGGLLWYFKSPMSSMFLRGGILWLAWLLLQRPVQQVVKTWSNDGRAPMSRK
ncbi:MAG: hypothetical protein IPL65_06330 [Lewinellaceae bacterium]|nr:hypothetical protein [Lewinellaceae bacterium]